MKNKETCSRLNRVGGQAVLEGIMMKAGDNCCTACRLENGEVAVNDRKFVSVRKKHKWLNIPILRGVINFIEMMMLSYSTLTASAEMLGIDEEAEETKAEKWMKKHLGIKLFDILMVIALILGVALCLGLFIYLPTLAVSGVASLFGIEELGIWRAVPEGFLKIAIFILYIYLVSLMPDIRRTFEYHGAEHKSIACFEAGVELTPENAKKYTRFHPRCGTSFLFVMLFIGIIVSLFIPASLNNILRSVIKLLLVPVIVGLGYEFILFAGKHPNALTRILSAPGLWMQRLTTREPDEKQLEVAIIAMKCALPEEFPDFDRDAYIKKPEESKTDEGKAEA
ncbi:MAG: DUF1385 domain-containing protein [Ruminococcaceae bacterium]|nr:DUF1385 domain-containing protein [Oscillospiraceae bacterium]